MGEVFNKNLKIARERTGLSQKDVAEKIGVAKSTYSLYESGNREPNVQTIKKIADVLHISADELLGLEEPHTLPAYYSTNKTDITDAHTEAIATSSKNEHDIAKRLESALDALESTQNALMFSGEPLDDETKELLKASLENSLLIGKLAAKRKSSSDKHLDD